MNRLEAAQKQWFDREVADRAEAEAWRKQRDAARAETRPPQRPRARPEGKEPALGWWQRLRRSFGLGPRDRAPTAGDAP